MKFNSTKRLSQLDGLRAFAVAAVAWEHWRDVWFNTSVIPYGDIGVDTFFVISGFLITGILLDNRPETDKFFTLRRFYIRRTLRIFPLFYVTLAVATLLQAASLSRSWLWHVSYLSNIYFYLYGWAGQLSHFWSLAVEEQFYLVWPLLMIFLPQRLLLPVMMAAVALAPVFESTLDHLFPNYSDSANILMPSCLDALGIGALLAYGVRRQFPMKRIAFALLLLGITVCVSCGFLRTPFERLGENCILGWLVYFAAEGFPNPFGWLLEYAPINYLGKISYGLYVIHNFAVSICTSLIVMLGTPEWFRIHYHLPWFRLPAFIIVTVGLASLSWHFFEKPINDLKRKFPYPVETAKSFPFEISIKRPAI